MRIELHKTASQGLGGKLMLHPGLNEVDPAAWSQAMQHSMTSWFLQQGIIRVLDECQVPVLPEARSSSYQVEPVDEQEVEISAARPRDLNKAATVIQPSTSLVGIPVRRALGLIAKADSAEVLVAMLEGESRKTIVEAIEARMDQLTQSP
jgi:hypothetical protein